MGDKGGKKSKSKNQRQSKEKQKLKERNGIEKQPKLNLIPGTNN